MFFKRKGVFLILTALLTLCLFAGCTGGKDPVDTTPEGTVAGDTAEGTSPESDTAAGPADTEPADTDPADTEAVTEDYFEINRIETVAPDLDKVPDMAVTDKGYDIYQLTTGKEWGYRYGCTYLYNDDGSIDAYFACVGTISGEWDWISYRHSPDGGETWEPEKVVLTPTQGSMDHFSNCDPGVIYFNGYYYLGYTSTLNSSGHCNNLFVARSENPDGPFDKWNGNGWGGSEPQPIVYFEEDWNRWGIGEPSFVELNGTLYMYYTNTTNSGEYCMVATADATNENWPATLQFHGVACEKQTDSIDVKYVEEWGKFVGVATGSRMGPNSWIGVYESNDGLTLELVDVVREGTYSHLHNAGISSRPNGHIRISEDADKLRVIYAYGEGWGTWNTRVQPISLTLSNGNDMGAERAKACLADEHLRADVIPDSELHVAMIRPLNDVYTYSVDKEYFLLRFKVYDTYFAASELDRRTESVTFTDYDESIIEIREYKCYIKGAGYTPVTVHYAGCSYRFHVYITEEKENTGRPTEAVELVPVHETMTIYYGERTIYKPQIRARMWWGDGSFTELYVDNSDITVTYTGYDESIISVSDTGVVTARKVGETNVTLTCKGKTCTVHVVVSDNKADSYFKMGDAVVLDYTNLDFTNPDSMEALSGLNSCSPAYDKTEGCLKATVTGGDTFFTLAYGMGETAIHTADYSAIEITYMVPADVSAAATNLQLFICAGTITDANANYQVMRPTVKDGEYHTVTIDLATLSYWTGDLHLIRFDYFDQAKEGDCMFIKSVRLVKAE